MIEAATGGVLQKKAFLKISEHSQENTCARVSFEVKLQALGRVFRNFKNTLFTDRLRTTASIMNCEFQLTDVSRAEILEFHEKQIHCQIW